LPLISCFFFKLAEYIVGRLTNVSQQRAFCLQPGYWTLFILDDETSQHLKERVDRYCGSPRNFDTIYNNLLNGIRYDQVIEFDFRKKTRFQMNFFLVTKLFSRYEIFISSSSRFSKYFIYS
jgi:hypothetical protein